MSVRGKGAVFAVLTLGALLVVSGPAGAAPTLQPPLPPPPPSSCQDCVIYGTLGSGSPDWPSVSGNQTTRIFRDNVPSACGSSKGCSVFTSGSFTFDAYTFHNSSYSPACVSVALEMTAGGTAFHSVAYLGSYDPANICTNYLADSGFSATPGVPTAYSFDVPPHSDYVVIVHNNFGTIDNYTLTVTDTEGPHVLITQPNHDEVGLPSVNIPINVAFWSEDGCGDVVHEEVLLSGDGAGYCTLWDGDNDGDRDGLLSDEGLQINKYRLCQAMSRCGMRILYFPEVVVKARDCQGNVGYDKRIIRRRLTRSEACSWPR